MPNLLVTNGLNSETRPSVSKPKPSPSSRTAKPAQKANGAMKAKGAHKSNGAAPVDASPVSSQQARGSAMSSPPDRIVQTATKSSLYGPTSEGLTEAWRDLAVHLTLSPVKQWRLAAAAMQNAQAVWAQAVGVSFETRNPGTATDKGFPSGSWQNNPGTEWFRAHQRRFEWWLGAVSGVHGIAPPHDRSASGDAAP